MYPVQLREMERTSRNIRYIDNGNVLSVLPAFSNFVYSALIPTICAFGIIGNLICLVVLSKMQKRCSFYVYLSVVATANFLTCIVLFVSGLSRGLLSNHGNWETLDSLIFLPIGECLNCISACATVFVTIDRLIYLKKPTQTFKPKFCKRGVAGRIMLFIACGSAVYVLPYCFVYKLGENWTVEKTPFYDSIYFTIYNWLDVCLLAVVPAIVLSIGNTMLFLSIRNACQILKDCQSKVCNGKIRVIVDQTKITITLVAIVFVHLIGEVPAHFTRRITSANILFGGDDKQAEDSVIMEYFRVATTLLNALHLAMKFILYANFCPPFCKALKNCVCLKKHRKFNRTTVKLYLIEINFLATLEKCAKECSQIKIFDSLVGKSSALRVQNILC
ncbi:hypothetical protein PPYR_00456 [Photinus pyralis]|uniref:G-protein coupled receptors family 1 profile domain-containing protein n=2 Tax=Photinus pyralis TaxID=7054 RepID=A0A5N4B1P6_PHOPY|nr:probable G-protein coupled receptor B0563.6 [Photinus pyralis]KAB0803486.1 hypothetical protein PPYR_00456 [Photinus pyralis]